MGFLKRLRKPRSGGPHIETVRAVAAAADARDADEYVKHMTEDVVVNPPGFLMGRHELHGKEQVRAAFAKFAEMLEPGRKLYVSKRRYVVDRADEAKILVLDELTVTPREGGPARNEHVRGGGGAPVHDDRGEQGRPARLLAERGGGPRPAPGPGRGGRLARDQRLATATAAACS
jgi:ketosteroid isomerase-like protein